MLAKYSYFRWKSNCKGAFEVVKEKLTTAPILRGPNWALPLDIHIDASDKVVGVALGQVQDKFPYDFYVISNNLSKAELNYIFTKKNS